MELTKFGHACVRIADGDRRLTIDPGVFTDVPQALADIDAVLITHEHADHLDVDRLAAAAGAEPGAAGLGAASRSPTSWPATRC